MGGPKQNVRASSIGFFSVIALIVIAASASLYLELKTRSVAAQIQRYRNNQAQVAEMTEVRTPTRTKSFPAGPEQTAGTDPKPEASNRWKWVQDRTLVEQQWKHAKKAEAAITYDRRLIRGTENQFQVRLRFNELYEMLGLNETEIGAFEKDMGDRNLTFVSFLTPDPKIKEDVKLRQAQSMEQIVENTLGNEYIEPFRLFLQTSDLHEMTRTLAFFSLDSGQPFESSQATKLLQACLESRQPNGGNSHIALDQIDWESVATRSQTFLAPMQQQLLRAMIDRRKFDQVFQNITGLPLRRPIHGLPSS